MNIGDVSRAIGLAAKTIRNDTDIGLVRDAQRAKLCRDINGCDARMIDALYAQDCTRDALVRHSQGEDGLILVDPARYGLARP